MSHQHQQQPFVHPQATTRESRDVLHRAIYDYFRKLALPQQHQQADHSLMHASFGNPFAVEDSTATTGASSALQNQAQSVLQVLEREFPNMLLLPGEDIQDPNVESELEKRFHGSYPPHNKKDQHQSMVQQQQQHAHGFLPLQGPPMMTHHTQHHTATPESQSAHAFDVMEPNPRQNHHQPLPVQQHQAHSGIHSVPMPIQHHPHQTPPIHRNSPPPPQIPIPDTNNNSTTILMPPPPPPPLRQEPPSRNNEIMVPPLRSRKKGPLTHPADRVDAGIDTDMAPLPPAQVMPVVEHANVKTAAAETPNRAMMMPPRTRPGAECNDDDSSWKPNAPSNTNDGNNNKQDTANNPAIAAALETPNNGDNNNHATSTDDTQKLAADDVHHQVELQKVKSQLRVAKRKIKKLKVVQTDDDEGNHNKKKKRRKKTHDTSNSTTTTTFEQRFQELVHYQKGYGHCRVPCTSKENPGLARWVQTMRAAYKEKQKRKQHYGGQLTDERQEQLETIGFEWSIQAKPKATWEQRFQDLKAFKVQHGHVRVVRSYPQDPSLGEWCHRQRFLAHKNELEAHKIQLLTDLGFEIWVRKQGKSWDDHFAMLLEFRRTHQHLKVPPPDTRTKVKQVLLNAAAAGKGDGTNDAGLTPGGDAAENGGETATAAGESGPPTLDPATEEYKEEQAFRRWVAVQRDNYHLKYLKGVTSPLTKARVKKLNGVGFDWTREGGENDLRKIRRGEFHHRNDPHIWNRRFEELLEYKKRFGDCNVPKEWPENKSLGAWVATQRKNYKAMLSGERSSLTNERRTALENIDFVWIVRPARTRPKILEIEGLQTMAAEML
ncbi:helicase [Seminavis robusta]|uniref:Helicase n=1 Tax=Seminavis robusta TaxID=568900 RepID=A0A9N8ESL4_9STRA|nr:helicase [Seminavis robusta]|eukprot:Sro1579_g283700.1 helicase (830) ;mRNA; f:5226-7997